MTGIVAARGLSGNWMWLSWIGVHAAVVAYFAARWRRSGALTDAELVALRYSGREAAWLRSFRAGLAGVVLNCIVLGWVMRAMVKIVHPFFDWKRLGAGPGGCARAGVAPGLAARRAVRGLSILALLLVGVYSTMGGIRGRIPC